MKSREFGKQVRKTGAVLLAALGGSALLPAVAYAKQPERCDVAGAVRQIKGFVLSGAEFNWPVAESSNPKGAVVLHARHQKPGHAKQLEYNPLIIPCASGNYDVGITSNPHGSLGRHYTVREPGPADTGLYIDVEHVSKLKALRSYLDGGHIELHHRNLQYGIIHPFTEQTNFPAFVRQPGPAVLENSAGVMGNIIFG